MAGSLDALLRPRSVAVIGASNRRKSLGGMVTERLFDFRFTGKIFPVNPRQEAIHSVKAWPSILDVPDPVDCAIVVVPRDAVPAAIDQCIEKGVGAVILITSGFRETGEEGRRLEEEVFAKLKAAGIRAIGPNCMGLLNTSPEVSLDATFTPVPALPGPIGFASQSGALGVVVLGISEERGIGFSQFVSLGNKADVTENDLLEAWEDDPEVPVITAYLESFADAPGFLRIARRVTRKKPVILVKAGRTEAGARAASSHTGALASADTGTDALCRQGGVLRVDTVEEMLDTAWFLAKAPLPAGPRVGILTNAGGPAILCADRLGELGLEIPTLGEATRKVLSDRLPPEAATGNPVDILPSATPEDFAACLAAMLEDPGIDAVISITVTPPLYPARDVLEAITPVARRAGKPVLPVFMVPAAARRELLAVEDAPALFRAPEDAAGALARAVAHARNAARPAEEPREFDRDDAEIAALLGRTLEDGGGYLPQEDVFRVLEIAGFPLAPWRVAGSREEVLAAAAEIEGPVVLKAVGPGIVHKSDLGGVALDLRDEAAVAAALDRMEEALDGAGIPREGRRWLVQAFRAGGREVILGAHRAPGYGPLVMCGLGGKYVEVFRDVQFAMADLTPSDAREMVRGIRGLALLTGTRGEEGVDLAPLEEGLERLAALVRAHREIAELDVNPLLLFPGGGAAVVDGRIRVAAD